MVKQNSNNGTTLRTRIVRDKTKYNRKQKHKKSFASAEDFAFQMPLGLTISRTKGRETRYVYFGKC